MLQRSNFESEFIRDVEHHHDFRSNVGMDMYHDLPAQDVGERFEFQVLSRRYKIFAALFRGLEVIPLLHISPGFGERLAKRLLDAQTSRRPAAVVLRLIVIVGPLGVFTQSELDSQWRAEQEFFGRMAPL